MTRLFIFRILRAARLLVTISMALVLPQASHAFPALGDTSCGQRGQPACTIVSDEWWQTGTSTGCDRGLISEWHWSDARFYCVDFTREIVRMSGWASNALRLQRELQANLPLNQLTVLGSHNAFNNVSDGYATPLAYNQLYSITDQLRMGTRLLALDIHWVNEALRLCHSSDVLNIGNPHQVCSQLDRPYFQIIEELNQWLRRPENSQEVVFLDLETYTDGHDAELDAPILAHLSDLVLRPSMMPKDRLPTLNEIRNTGKRVIITNGKSARNDLYIPMESTQDLEDAYVKNFSASPCGYARGGVFTPIDPTHSHTNARTTFYEDSTVYAWFWNGPEQVGVITSEKLRELTACNVTGITMDQITADKIEHAVWSWDENEPTHSTNGNCAEMRDNGRWGNATCGEARRFACRNKYNPAEWLVTSAAREWQQGASQCESEYPGYEFAVPRTGYENQRLAAAAQGQNVWLNLNDIAAEGTWAPHVVELRALGKCMDDSSGSANTGATVQLWDCQGRDRQKWLLPGDGTIRSAINSNKCLDLFSSNTNNGGSIGLWDCHGGVNQRWILSGGYLRSALNWNKVIDVSGGSTANGARLLIWDYHGGGNQKWLQVQ